MMVLAMAMSDASLVLAITTTKTSLLKTATDAMRAGATCNTIEAQITAAQALEDYTEARYEAHKQGSDYWACSHAAEAYSNACNARVDLQYLNSYLCDELDPAGPCFMTTCNQAH